MSNNTVAFIECRAKLTLRRLLNSCRLFGRNGEILAPYGVFHGLFTQITTYRVEKKSKERTYCILHQRKQPSFSKPPVV